MFFFEDACYLGIMFVLEKKLDKKFYWTDFYKDFNLQIHLLKASFSDDRFLEPVDIFY